MRLYLSFKKKIKTKANNGYNPSRQRRDEIIAKTVTAHMIKNTLQALLISLSIAGCNSAVKEKIKPAPRVLYEIFPTLIDTLHYDSRLTLHEVNNNTFKLDSLARDTTSIVIVISDTLEHLNKDDYLSLQSHLKGLSIEVDSLKEDSLIIMDFAKLQASDKRIKFRPLSSFPTGLEFWKTDDDFYLSAKFFFSNILFNKDKTSGLLHVGYVCGPYQCGEGFRVYIKKEKDKWKIEKIEDTWAM